MPIQQAIGSHVCCDHTDFLSMYTSMTPNGIDFHVLNCNHISGLMCIWLYLELITN